MEWQSVDNPRALRKKGQLSSEGATPPNDTQTRFGVEGEGAKGNADQMLTLKRSLE